MLNFVLHAALTVAIVAAAVAFFAARFFAATIDDVITTDTQSLFSLFADTAVAITEGCCQYSNDLWVAAAVVLAELITNSISSSFTDEWISIVHSVQESTHDFW